MSSFLTESVLEAEQEKAARAESESVLKSSDGSEQLTGTKWKTSGGDWGTMGRSGLAGDLPDLESSDTAGAGGRLTSSTSEAPLGNGTTAPSPEGAGVSVNAAVGASVGALAAAGSLAAGLVLWKRRPGAAG